MRFTDAELSLIKNTFAENEELLKAMRKVFLQMPLDVIDRDILGVFKSKELLAVVSKTFLPELDANAPLHQLVDLMMTIDLKEKTPEDAYPHILARKEVIEYLRQQMGVLESLDVSGVEVAFASLADITEKSVIGMYVDLTARNTIIAHTEQQLEQLRILAGVKEETVEETQKRLQRDSTK